MISINTDKLFQNKIDACVLLTAANRFYFTGLSTSSGCVVLFPDKKYFVTDTRYELAARSLTDFEVVIAARDTFAEEVKGILSQRKVKYVGFEDLVTYADYKSYKAALHDYTLKSITEHLALMRCVKTAEEIELIAASQAVNESALKQALKYLKAGVSEIDVAAEIIYAMRRGGAESEAFPAIVAAGENSAKPHCIPSDREIEKGEHVMIDIGARVNGYCSDMTRTVCIGQPKKEIAKMHQDVWAAQEYALKNIKAGITAHEADSFAREFLLSRGYDGEFSHSLGHGVGIDIHEIPFIGVGRDTVLEENMVITVEPGVYRDGIGGVRIEDLVVVKKDGIKNLTNFDKSFII